MSELKPCPFCGSEKVDVKQDSVLICGHRHWFIEHLQPSSKCPLVNCLDWWRSSCKFTTKEKAIEAWNRRASE